MITNKQHIKIVSTEIRRFEHAWIWMRISILGTVVDVDYGITGFLVAHIPEEFSSESIYDL